jgi:hypothetical protein
MGGKRGSLPPIFMRPAALAAALEKPLPIQWTLGSTGKGSAFADPLRVTLDAILSDRIRRLIERGGRRS